MKSRIELGAKRRAVAGGASAGSRRGGASVGREIERTEVIDYGYAVCVGCKRFDSSGDTVFEYLNADGSGTVEAERLSILTDYADACEKCAAAMRELVGEECRTDFPSPEYPRVVYVRLSASVMGVA